MAQQIMDHLHILNTIFYKSLEAVGFCPWNSKKREKHRFQLIITILTMLYISLCYFFLFCFSDIIFAKYVTFGKYNDMFKSSSVLLSFLLISLESYWCREYHYKLWQQFNSVEIMFLKNFPECDMVMRKRLMFKNFYTRFYILLFLMIFVEINIFQSIIHRQQFVIFYMIFIIPVSLNRLRHFQYNLHICHMNTLFETLNYEIKLLAENEIDVEKKLRMLMIIYDNLYEISVNINICFGWSNVSNISDNINQILVDFYWFYWKQSINYPQYVYNWGGHFIDYILRITPTLFIVFIVLNTNKKCVFESRCVGSSIHRIAMRYDDENFNAKLKCYSLQILHERIDFTAKDMAPITMESLRTVSE